MQSLHLRHALRRAAGLILAFAALSTLSACRKLSPRQTQFGLIEAMIMQRQYAQAERLLRQDPALLGQQDSSKRTVLLIAVSQRNPSPDFIRTLLSLRANVNAANDLGITPLMVASARDDTTVPELLLRAGADPNRRDNAGLSALNRAVHFSRTKTAKLLIENGAQSDIFDAAALGLANEVAAMVRRDSSLATRRGDHGVTALQVAAFRKQSAVVGILLPLQPELDLCTAAAVGEVDTLRKSLLNKASPNKPTGNGFPPLLCAVTARQTKSTEVLLNFGAHVTGGTVDGVTSPLVTAIRNGDKDMVALLLQHGADKNEFIPGFGTPYTIALATKRPDIAELLK